VTLQDGQGAIQLFEYYNSRQLVGESQPTQGKEEIRPVADLIGNPPRPGAYQDQIASSRLQPPADQLRKLFRPQRNSTWVQQHHPVFVADPAQDTAGVFPQTGRPCS